MACFGTALVTIALPEADARPPHCLSDTPGQEVRELDWYLARLRRIAGRR